MNTNKSAKDNDCKVASYRGDIELKNMIKKEIEFLDKKKKGTLKVAPIDIIKVCLPLITNEQRDILLRKTISPMDRQKVAFSNYKKKYPRTTKVQFLGLIQNQEVDLNTFLTDDMKMPKKL